MTDAILLVLVLLISVVFHENAHGWVALALGDTTAKSAGRLTLNPVKHIDPVGSVIMPAFLAFTAHTAFGYAKPVPVNPRSLRGSDKVGFAVVAVAGPVCNLLLAFLGGLIGKGLFSFSNGGLISPGSLGFQFLQDFIAVNVLLAAFNLVPIPPLDGSRLLRLVLNRKGIATLDRIEPYGFLILILLLVMLPTPLFRIVGFIRGLLLRIVPL